MSTPEIASVPESHWNYRVTRTVVDDEYVFEIREVYYDHGEPNAWTEEAIAPHGDSWHELADDLVKMQRAVSLPVLDLTGEKPREMTASERAQSRLTWPGSQGSDV